VSVFSLFEINRKQEVIEKVFLASATRHRDKQKTAVTQVWIKRKRWPKNISAEHKDYRLTKQI